MVTPCANRFSRNITYRGLKGGEFGRDSFLAKDFGLVIVFQGRENDR